MRIENMIVTLTKLGEKISVYLKKGFPPEMKEAIKQSNQHNLWFTEENILFSLNAISELLCEEKLNEWLFPYKNKIPVKYPKKIAVIMAGNIPLVGFHDFLCVLISGNIFIGKLSSQDKFLLPAVASELIKIESSFKDRIVFTEEMLKGFDAVIATGSDNSSRYFDYYFGKYPHIIRKNRNSVAILTGDENIEDLKKLADDIFLYFGLGCRNVTKIFVPENYNFSMLLEALEKYKHGLSMHSKYLNNYEYQKSILLINQVVHTDTGFCILKEDVLLASPISVLHYEYYSNIESVLKNISENAEKIQCLLAKEAHTESMVLFGKSQQPELWDYADRVDTMKFLLNLPQD